MVSAEGQPTVVTAISNVEEAILRAITYKNKCIPSVFTYSATTILPFFAIGIGLKPWQTSIKTKAKETFFIDSLRRSSFGVTKEGEALMHYHDLGL